MAKTKRTARKKSGQGKRRHRLISPTVAWSAIFAFAALACLPVMIAVSEFDSSSETIELVTERTLCFRSCLSGWEDCRQMAGLYQPALDRCDDGQDKCRQDCGEESPSQPEGPSLQSCAHNTCQPIKDACLKQAQNDTERGQCENRHLDCLTECRLQNQTGTPQPVSSLPNPSPTANYTKAERLAFGKAKQSIYDKLSQLSPTIETIERLSRQGLTVPESLAKSVAAAQQAAQQATAASSMDDLRSVGADTELDAALAEADRYGDALDQLGLFVRVYDQASQDLSKYEQRLTELKNLTDDRTEDLDEPISDYDRLLDVARTSLDQSKKRIGAGDAEEGLDILETGVLDNLKEISAIDQASRWALNGTATLQGTQLVNIAASRLTSSAANSADSSAEYFLDELRAKLDQIDEATANELPDTQTVFILCKELIDIQELFRAALNDLSGQESDAFRDYLNS